MKMYYEQSEKEKKLCRGKLVKKFHVKITTELQVFIWRSLPLHMSVIVQ